MTDFKNSKQVMYSTPIGVRQVLTILARQTEDEETGENLRSQDILDPTIEAAIHEADSIIQTYLAGTYGASTLIDETPYFLSPVSAANGTSDIVLNGIIVASTTITEQWLILFTSTTAFTVTGSVSGAQGSGSTAADFTSTNSDIQIKSEDWVGDNPNADKGDQIIVGTYISRPIIRTLSEKLAAAYLIASLYSEINDSEPKFVENLKKEVYKILDKLIDPDSPMSLTETSLEDILAYEAVPYNINKYGDDVTPYADIDPADIDPLSN